MKDFKELELIETYNEVTKLFYIAEQHYHDENEKNIIGYGNTIEEAYKYTICNLYEKYKELIFLFKKISSVVSEQEYLKEDLYLNHPMLTFETDEGTIEYDTLIYDEERNEWMILRDGFFIKG